jgi:S-adenosylmethionine:tRNA ribosyltransferase-isomerase
VQLSEFDYELPPERIAKVPASPRDSARLFVDSPTAPRHLHVRDLPGELSPGDVMVLNTTRVLPARIRATRSSGGSAEVLLLTELEDGWWEALVRPSAKLKPGSELTVSDTLRIELGRDLGEGLRHVRPQTTLPTLLEALDLYGEMPLPPYLGAVELSDAERYQTVYSQRPASAAAPTAGLHFTPDLLSDIAARGIAIHYVELVVGLGTFRPITTERIEDHQMHSELYSIEPDTWDSIMRAKSEGARVLAVGTTSVRALESAAATKQLSGPTDLFIRPGFEWKVVDRLMTNFHLPKSSLLVMLAAFMGDRWREVYAAAAEEGYRFLSFGDAMLVERA